MVHADERTAGIHGEPHDVIEEFFPFALVCVPFQRARSRSGPASSSSKAAAVSSRAKNFRRPAW